MCRQVQRTRTPDAPRAVARLIEQGTPRRASSAQASLTFSTAAGRTTRAPSPRGATAPGAQKSGPAVTCARLIMMLPSLNTTEDRTRSSPRPAPPGRGPSRRRPWSHQVLGEDGDDVHPLQRKAHAWYDITTIRNSSVPRLTWRLCGDGVLKNQSVARNDGHHDADWPVSGGVAGPDVPATGVPVDMPSPGSLGGCGHAGDFVSLLSTLASPLSASLVWSSARPPAKIASGR